MKRRDLLARTAALAAGGVLAGCIGDGDTAGPGDGSDGTDGQGDGQATPTGTPTETATPTPTETATPTPTETATPEETRLLESTVLESRGDCGMANEASVAFESGLVRITGTIKASDPCHTARIASADLDEEGNLAVTVTVESQGGMCTQCVGGISYEATVGFEGPTPPSVAVVHDSMDDRREVATARPR